MGSTDRAAELLETLEAEVSALVSGADWQHLLDVGSKLHRYSFGNVMLAKYQRPDVSMLAGYQAWRKMGRQVRKGERAITILAPMRAKRTDADGTEHHFLRGFKAASVFDVAQTDGPELPPPPQLLEGDGIAGIYGRIAADLEAEGWSVESSPSSEGGPNGSTDPSSRTVWVRSDASESQRLKTLIHELAHIRLEHIADLAAYVSHRGIAEVEAESVAYVVAGSLGMSTDGYSFQYVAGWSGGDVKKVRAAGERVMRAAKLILERLEGPEAAGDDAAERLERAEVA